MVNSQVYIPKSNKSVGDVEQSLVSDSGHVRIFDTTLRDGEQSPGCSMNLEEKVKVALILEEMGVDIIEAGFPIASNGDFDAVREVARALKTKYKNTTTPTALI